MKNTNSKKKSTAAVLEPAVSCWPPAAVLAREEQYYTSTVVFDLHGPILDWTGPFCEFASTALGVELDPAKQTVYSLADDPNMPITGAQFSDLFKQFARLGVGGYGSLPLQPDIVNQLNRIRASGINIKICTWTPGALDHHADTLESVGTGVAQRVTFDLLLSSGIVKDPLKEVVFISPSKKCLFMAEKHVPLIVEDYAATGAQVASYGLGALLVPEPHNLGCEMPGMKRLTDRLQLADAVIAYFDILRSKNLLSPIQA